MNNFRPNSFNLLPYVIKNLVIINGLMFLAQTVLGYRGEFFFNEYLALHSIRSEHFKLYQLLTHLFVHADFEHFFYNMFSLWMFGSILENIWGEKKFITFYLICGLCAAIAHLTTLWFQQKELAAILDSTKLDLMIYDRVKEIINVPTVGASGAVFGCLAAFGVLFPNTYLYIYFLLPIKTKWFVILYIGAEMAYSIFGRGDNIAHLAHLGGALAGFIIAYTDKKRNSNFF